MGCATAVLITTAALLGTGHAHVAHAFAQAQPTAVDAPAAPSPAAGTLIRTPVVVVGFAGLTWTDLSPDRTPTLWGLLDDGAPAAAVTTVQVAGRTACPDGGWLSLATGFPVAGRMVAGGCRPYPLLRPAGDGVSIAGWPGSSIDLGVTIRRGLGTLAEAVELRGCATAVGPGAAMALADQDGTVARYRPEPVGDAFDCPVTLVDVGVVPPAEVAPDATGPITVDTAIGRLLAVVPPSATVVISSLSGPVGEPLQMGVLVVAGTDPGDGLLSSPSTRRAGVVRTLDIPSTLAEALAIPEPSAFQGAPIARAGDRGSVAETVEMLADITVADSGLRSTARPLINTVGGISLLLVLLALLTHRRIHGGTPRRVLAGGLLLLAALPVASYLVTLTSWWDFASPRAGLRLGMVAIALGLAGLVAAVARRPAWRIVLALSMITTLVLVIDGLTGTHLHWGSPLGTSAVIGSRFYGFGNTTFAVLAVHGLVLAGLLASRLVLARRRAAATLSVIMVGVVTVAVDTWPTWGADVGGGLALIPAFGLLALAVSGARLTAIRVLGALAGGVALVAGVAMVDWLRPAAQRSHAGRFVQQIVDGSALTTLDRKIDYAVESLQGGMPIWITAGVLIWGVLAVARPGRCAPTALQTAMGDLPALRATLGAVLTTAVVGSLVNDWGLRIALVMLAFALPVVGALCVLGDQRRRIERTVERSPASTTTPSTTSATAVAPIAPSTAVVSDASANPSPTR